MDVELVSGGQWPEAVGFLPLEERTDIWGPEDPCLISVKTLD